MPIILIIKETGGHNPVLQQSFIHTLSGANNESVNKALMLKLFKILQTIERIFEDHMMRNFQRLPVLIRYKTGLNQEAVDKSENNNKEHEPTSQQTYKTITKQHIFTFLLQ